MVWVGEDGMSFAWDCVGCCIGEYPTFPSSPPALRSGPGSTMSFTYGTMIQQDTATQADSWGEEISTRALKQKEKNN